MVAHSCSDGEPNGSKTVRDTQIRYVAMVLLSHCRGRIENGPGGATNTNAGAYLSPTLEPGNEAYLSLPSVPLLEPKEAQRYVIEMLDALRRQAEAMQVNKPRYMLLARKYGLSHAEIAAVLGMSEGAVRQAVKRARDTPLGLIESTIDGEA